MQREDEFAAATSGGTNSTHKLRYKEHPIQTGKMTVTHDKTTEFPHTHVAAKVICKCYDLIQTQ